MGRIRDIFKLPSIGRKMLCVSIKYSWILTGDGDWGWLDVNIDEDGEQFYELEVPETPDDFWFDVFSMSKENGIGLTRQTYNTIR